jgi:hypothetical protein
MKEELRVIFNLFRIELEVLTSLDAGLLFLPEFPAFLDS